MHHVPVSYKHDRSPVATLETTSVKGSDRLRHRSDGQTVAVDLAIPAKGPGSLAAVFAKAFGKLNFERRARLLGRLLGSVGPMALVVIGGGFFAKYLRNARSPQVPISSADVARATSSQVYDVVRYVEQSNPRLVAGLLAMLLKEQMTTTALGISSRV